MYDPRMDDAKNLRHQAKRAERLAGLIADRQASEALAAYAAKLLAQAEFLEEDARSEAGSFCRAIIRAAATAVSTAAASLICRAKTGSAATADSATGRRGY
jgi:hypothetical protein